MRHGHRDFGDDRQREQDDDQPGQGLLGKSACRVRALAFQPFGKQRYERGVESPLAKQSAKQVGEAEGHEERIGDAVPDQRCRDQDVTQKSEDAADHRQAADGSEGTVEFHVEP